MIQVVVWHYTIVITSSHNVFINTIFYVLEIAEYQQITLHTLKKGVAPPFAPYLQPPARELPLLIAAEVGLCVCEDIKV